MMSLSKRKPLTRWVPGMGPGSGSWLAIVFSAFFYLYLVVILIRLPAFVGMIDWVRLLEFASVAAGLVVLYLCAMFFERIDQRPLGQVFRERMRRFRANRLGSIGLVVFLVFVCASLLAPLLTPYAPSAQIDPAHDRYKPPSQEHLMGTDKFGRDVYSRVLYGARVSLAVGVASVILASIFGMIYGAFAGYVGGWVDDVSMRIVDGLLAFPRLVLLLTLLAVFSNSFFLVIIVLSVTGWMGVARLVRAEVLSLKEREFVQAAVATGAGRARIVWRHLIPNAVGPVIVTATLRIGLIILLESYLSFLGLGVQPPAPSWGSMVFEGRDVLLSAWWVSAFPGLAIVMTVIACNLLGDGLRDAMEVRTG
jgi:peptide/nickel transport system permease protein